MSSEFPPHPTARAEIAREGWPLHVAHGRSLQARPEPLRFDPATTALIVVDMQNAYVSPGGYMDRAGFDISQGQAVAAQTARALALARGAGIQVVYLQNGWDAQYVEAGGPGSPNWHKSNALKTMRREPSIGGSLLSKGGWDYALIETMQPRAGEIVVAKTRYSGFFNSTLDSTLRARGIRTLIFAGVATNVCVESTLRDAYHLEYFCVVLEDAVTHAGPAFVGQASLYTIETFFGWVSDTARLEAALAEGEGAGEAPGPLA